MYINLKSKFNKINFKWIGIEKKWIKVDWMKKIDFFSHT